MEPQNILEMDHLTVVFQREGVQTIAADDVSFSMKKGEILGIVGESGSGKSVTALSILQLLPSGEGEFRRGEILYRDVRGSTRSLLSLTDRQMREIRGKEIGIIFQEPMTSLNPVLTCGFQVAETLRIHMGIRKQEAKMRSLEWFEEVKLPSPARIYESYPHQLSGGQKQRVMIAMAMACKPGLLIADEPTTALDVTVQKTILELMKELQIRHGMSILFITHDLALISGFADRILVMYRGKIVEQGVTGEVFKAPSHPYTAGLLNCRPPSGIRPKKLPSINDFLNPETKSKPALSIETAEERKERHLRLFSSPPILEVHRLETVFPSHYSLLGRPDQFVHAVDDVSFRVYPGETLGIVGESGCGKTTLGRTILNLIQARSGKIIYKGREIRKMTNQELRSLRQELQIIFQDPYSSLNPRLTAGAAIMEPMLVQKKYRNAADRKARAMELLEMVGLNSEYFFRYPHEFSGGQRQRVCIARTLAVNPRLIICDESVSALDVSVQAQILNLLNQLKNEFGFTYLFISHDLSVVWFMSDRLIVMKNGRIEEMGDADAIYSAPEKDYTKLLLNAVPRIRNIAST